MAAADPTLVGLLREARDILVFSGAGISTGSGIADYRGPSGVWKTKRPVYFNFPVARCLDDQKYWRHHRLTGDRRTMHVSTAMTTS